MKFIYGSIILLVLSGCTSETPRTFSDKDICKVGISMVMDREPSEYSIKRVDGEVVYISYGEESQVVKHGYKCKIQGNQIVWAAGNGRWMLARNDAKLTFKTEVGKISVIQTFSNEETREREFTFQQL